MPYFWKKNWYIDTCNKEQIHVADEIKRDIWKYLVSSDVADDAWYKYACYGEFRSRDENEVTVF